MTTNIDLTALKERVKAEEGGGNNIPAATLSPENLPAAATVVPEAAAKALGRLYKCAQRSMQVFMPDGEKIVFAGGRFHTDQLHIINYLDDQLKRRGLPNIFIDAEEPFFDPEKYDPALRMERQIRAKIEAEYAERYKDVVNPSRDMGTSTQGKLNAVTTQSIAPLAVGNGSSGTIPVTQVAAKQV